jgi:hypothetical protein
MNIGPYSWMKIQEVRQYERMCNFVVVSYIVTKIVTNSKA